MNIILGQTCKNRTYIYLRPALKLLGPTFVAKFNNFSKLAYGIHDTMLDGTPIEYQRTVFVLIDKLFQPAITQDCLNWIRNQEFYISDYPFDGFEGRTIMLILEFPEKHGDIYDKFLDGQYSYMYTHNELEDLFTDGTFEKNILIRNKSARLGFVARVNEIYNSNATVEDFKGTGVQYDFPPIQKEEYFNFKE